jgi:hypothetical protein
MPFCISCGKENITTAKFCLNCGHAIKSVTSMGAKQDTSAPDQTNTQKSEKPGVIDEFWNLAVIENQPNVIWRNYCGIYWISLVVSIMLELMGVHNDSYPLLHIPLLIVVSVIFFLISYVCVKVLAINRNKPIWIFLPFSLMCAAFIFILSTDGIDVSIAPEFQALMEKKIFLFRFFTYFMVYWEAFISALFQMFLLIRIFSVIKKN